MHPTHRGSQSLQASVGDHGRLRRLELLRPTVRHLIQAFLLSMGAPLGWILILQFTGGEPGRDVAEHSLLYGYMFLATALVFSAFGWLLGRKEMQLNHLIAQLDHQTITDPLTGLYNRRYFFDRVEELCERAGRLDRPFALAIVDLDHFKLLNDRFGHPAGDRVLRAVSRVLSAHVRKSEIVARIGGEEFGLLFPESAEAEAVGAVERLLQALADGVAKSTGLQELTTVTASAGIVHTRRLADIPDSSQVMAAADSALYRAKDLGRNRAVPWTARAPGRMRVIAPETPASWAAREQSRSAS